MTWDKPRRLTFRYPLGEDFELRGEFPAGAGTPSDFACKIYFAVRHRGLIEPSANIPAWVSACVRNLDSGRSGVSLYDANVRPVAPEQSVILRPENAFVFRLRDGLISLEINGARVFADCPAPPKTNHYEEVEFGFELPPMVLVCPSKLEVHKLEPAPPPPELLPPSGGAEQPRPSTPRPLKI